MNRILFNDQLVDESDAYIRIDDSGWLHGAGLFETIRAENGRAFRYEQHLRRLMNSAARLLHPIERTDLPSENRIQELLLDCGLADARIRLTVTAGSVRGPAGEPTKPTVCVAASPLRRYEDLMYENGVRVIISSIRLSPSDPIAGHKSTCYLPRLMALRQAQAARCLEALWFTCDHHLAEGSISNVFLVVDDKLVTPPLSTPVLPGIIRNAVLEIAGNERMAIEEKPLTIDDVFSASEIFLTNTMMQVLPVVGVEKHTVGAGTAGKVARHLLAAVASLVRQECAGA